MSSRALRKAQREREEQERLRRLEQEQESSENEDDIIVAPARKSAFAMLGEEEDEEHEEEEDEAETIDPAPSTTELAVHQADKPSSRKKKKKKKTKRDVADTADATEAQNHHDNVDEIDIALRELATSRDTATDGKTTAGVDASTEELCRLLSIDTNSLRAQNEIRRLFGRVALDDEEDAPQQHNAAGGNRRQQRRLQQVGLAQALRGQRGQGGRSAGLAALSLRRNIFMQGKEDWPVATGGGLGMDVVEKHADGVVEYRFVHNQVYQSTQGRFEACVASMDPDRLVALLKDSPYHISTLLQVSEIAKQERDHATSGDLLERALFSMGRAVHSTFAKSLAEGRARMDFRRPENREFWLASWRYMQNLTMRATWRTIHQWAKLLLSLSPHDDPYGMWLVLDQYALRSRQDLDYLNLSRAAQFQKMNQEMPNIHFSQALAEFRGGSQGRGKQALFKVVGRYPWAVARLMQELQIDPPPAIWGKQPRSEKEKLYTEMYAVRAKDVWNTPEHSALLVEVASALPPDTPSAPEDKSEIALNDARHVLLSDDPTLIALVPRKYTTALQSSSDPLPPPDSVVSYYPSAGSHHAVSRRPEGSPADDLRELQGLYHFFSRLFPWFNGTYEDPTGEDTDGNAADQRQRPSEDEIEQLIRQSGFDEGVVVERTHRMMELQRRLLGEHDVMEQAVEAINEQDEAENRRIRGDATEESDA